MNASNPGWDRQTMPGPGQPHGWIQWKGTKVCMDVHCACGAHCHIDADFAYFLKCPHCQRVYMTNGHIELVELTADERQALKDLRTEPKVCDGE